MRIDDIDIESFNALELEELRKRIDRQINKARERDREEALKEMREIARARGIHDLEELITGRPKGDKPRRGILPPKYRNPEDADVTWSGRGKRPSWYLAHLEAGGSESDMLIDGEN